MREEWDIEALYERYGPMVLRRCRALLHDEQQALDAMQEVFVLLLRHQARLDQRAPSSLLLQMATNVCLNQLRSRSRRREDPEDELLLAIATSPDPEERSFTRQLLGRLFAASPATTGAMAVMHLVDGMTLEEVAREVGLSVSGVRKRLRGLRASAMELQGECR